MFRILTRALIDMSWTMNIMEKVVVDIFEIEFDYMIKTLNSRTWYMRSHLQQN